MSKIIKYSRIVQSVAAIKSPNQSGLHLSKTKDDCVKFQAINPKTNDVTTWLSMELPVENISELIDILKTMM